MVVRENRDLDRAVAALLDPGRKLFGGDIGRVVLIGEMRKAHGDRGGAGDVGGRDRQARNPRTGLQEASAIHGFLLCFV